MSRELENRVEFSLLVEVINGNPNGDPDNANRPRIDDETGLGLISDVCTKRKIRNYVKLRREEEDGFRIYIDNDKPLNEKHKEAWAQLKDTSTDQLKPAEMKILPKATDKRNALQRFMSENYWDIRAFGAVMNTEVNCGILTGPVQINFGKSVDPVTIMDLSIIRKALTKQKDFDEKENTMGDKSIIPYGLYRINGYVSANQAQKTGFGEADLDLLIEALQKMYEDDHSSQRGEMNARKLVVYKHASKLGEAPAFEIFDTLKIQKKDNVVYPRSYHDYTITLDTSTLPDSIEVKEYIS